MTIPNGIADRPNPPSPEDIKAQYGFVAALAAAIPEINNLLQQAVREQWTADRFSMAVANTGWWKSTPAQNREWLVKQLADPASADRELTTGASQIEAMAGQMGFGPDVLTRQMAKDIWLHGKLSGDNEQQVRSWIFKQVSPLIGKQPAVGGEYGQLIQQARSIAEAYGYSGYSEAAIREAASEGLRFGTAAQTGLAGWTEKMRQYAKAKYAPFADRIDAGETVADIAQPYRESIANVLELNIQDVGLQDKYVQRWLQGSSEAGKPPVATSVWQAEQELRKDERWQYTRNAWKDTAQAATQIGKAFGMIGS